MIVILWQTLLFWVFAFLIMILLLPFHMINFVLTRIFGISIPITVFPMKRSEAREDAPDIRSRIDTVVTRGGHRYTLHTRFLGKTTASKKPTKNKSARPVVFLHGAYADSGMWTDMMRRVSRMGHDVYALDLPGFGSSTYPGEILDLEAPALASELADLTHAYLGDGGLGLSRVVLVGYSFGGFVGALAAGHAGCGRLVDSMLLVAPAGVYPVGSRWCHLHAVVFRLKMLSMLSFELQNQGENLIMRFFETGLQGSRWLVPTLGMLMRFGKPCRVLGGSRDYIFTTDHGILLEEISRGAIRYDGCPLTSHYFFDKSSLLEEYLIRSFRKLTRNSRTQRRRVSTGSRYLRALGQRLDMRVFWDDRVRVGVESSSFLTSFGALRDRLCSTARDVRRVIDRQQHNDNRNNVKNKIIKQIPKNKEGTNRNIDIDLHAKRKIIRHGTTRMKSHDIAYSKVIRIMESAQKRREMATYIFK
jgi:pimeloyl-ACP methyl ester carboxylesterase